MAAEVHRRKPSPPNRGANRAGNPPAPPARASSPQGCQRTAPPGLRPSGDQPPTLDTSEYPPYPPTSRRPSGNKPKATGTPSGTRTASLTGGNQPRTFKSRQTALSIIPQPREPTRTIINRAGSRFPNPAPAGINPIYSKIKGSKRETVPAPAGINHENPERPRHDDAFPRPRGNCGCTTPTPAGITPEGEGSTPPQQPLSRALAESNPARRIPEDYPPAAMPPRNPHPRHKRN